MKHPSQHTWELIRGLYASQSLWEKLVGNQEPSLSLFDEIGATDEALAIPHLTPFLLSGRSQVRDAAARSIGRLFNNVRSSDYPHLDEACRNDWAYESIAPTAWGRLKPTDVKQFLRLPNPIAVIGVTSFHGNGFVRYTAVHELAQIFDGLELPFLLVRLNDWVGAVRESAATAILNRIRTDYGQHFFRHLRLVFRLRACGRSQHEQIVTAVADLLQAPDAAPLLREGITSADRWLRRESFRLAISAKSAQNTELLKEILSDADPIMRLWAAKDVLSRLDDAELGPLLSGLLRDPFMPVRCEALTILSQRTSTERSRALRDALLDSHSSVRALARYWMRMQEPQFDFASFYRKAVVEGPAGQQRAAILGLGEARVSADANAVVPFLNAPFVGLRKAAIRTLAVLDQDRYVDQFITALTDEHPGISNEATRALASKTALITEQLQELFQAELPKHVRKNVFRLLIRQPFWARGIFLFQALRDRDEHLVELGLRGFRDWLTRSRSMAVGPTPSELRKLHASLKASAGMLAPHEVQELEFCLKSFK
jgi:HEAT repeat protein